MLFSCHLMPNKTNEEEDNLPLSKYGPLENYIDG